MTWLRLDDNFTDHPKVERLSDSGFRAHVRALCYAARFATDGAIPKNKLGKLGVTKRVLFDLIQSGLWEERDDEFLIHDFLKYNPSKAERERQSANSSAAANARWNANGIAGGNAYPSRPSPTHPDPAATPTRSLALRLYEGMGWTAAPNVLHLLDEIDSDYNDEWIGAAFEQAAASRARNLKYVTAILDHWKDHGRDCECAKPRTTPAREPFVSALEVKHG